MAKDPIMAKLASRGKAQAPKSAGRCTSCGGELIWTRVHTPRARMMKVCEKCGVMLPKTLNGF